MTTDLARSTRKPDALVQILQDIRHQIDAVLEHFEEDYATMLTTERLYREALSYIVIPTQVQADYQEYLDQLEQDEAPVYDDEAHEEELA